MIQQLCNKNHEQIDTFYKVAIIQKESLANFSHLTSDDDIETIITSIPDSANALITELLPENLVLSPFSNISRSGVSYQVNASFLITPQDKALKNLLDQYMNKEVVFLLDKHGTTYVYGTTMRPLLMAYDDLHSSKPDGLKGYVIKISGKCYGSHKILEDVYLNIYSRGLAFELTGSL